MHERRLFAFTVHLIGFRCSFNVTNSYDVVKDTVRAAALSRDYCNAIAAISFLLLTDAKKFTPTITYVRIEAFVRAL